MFRSLCWCVHSVAFVPPADLGTQSSIDLTDSEKTISDKERTREDKCINTRLVPPLLNAHETSLMLTASTRSVVKFTHVGKRDFQLGRELCKERKVILLDSIRSPTLADEDMYQRLHAVPELQVNEDAATLPVR